MSKKNKTTSYRDNVIQRSQEASIVRKIVAIIIGFLLILFVVGGTFVYSYIKNALEPVDPDSEDIIEVSIPLGSSTSQIAQILEENGVIQNAKVFSYYTKFKNESGFQAGDYQFTAAQTLDEIIATLKSGRVLADAKHTITIPEGKTVDEIAEIFSNQLHFTKEDFLEKVNDVDYINQLIRQYPTILSDVILDPDIRTPLEGYLFAATYSFYEDEPSIEFIVESMLDKTVEVVRPYLPEIEQKGFTVHEALTFASLLEKEAQTVEQRKMIAGIFYNRLEIDMMLQTDPTVSYAVGKHLSQVLYEDLEVDSPYNTYRVKDLPIGPISNFGENSLDATLFPEETNYIYFLHDPEGNIHYSETYEEHLRLRDQYLRNSNGTE